jgi:hypothetical protein
MSNAIAKDFLDESKGDELDELKKSSEEHKKQMMKIMMDDTLLKKNIKLQTAQEN